MNFDDTDIDNELSIHMESAYTLEKDLVRHPKRHAKYYRWRAQAVRELDDLNLDMEVLTSEIVQELLKEHKIPPSAQAEFRRIHVPLDIRYQKLQRKINKAKEKVDILTGMIKGAESQGYRLGELVDMARKLLLPDMMLFNRDINIDYIETREAENTEKMMQNKLTDWRGEE